MESYLPENALSGLMLLPVATAALLLASRLLASILLGARGLPETGWWLIGFAGSACTLLYAIAVVAVGFDPERIGLQMQEHRVWLPSWGVSYFVGLDGLSLCMVLLTCLLVPLAWITSWRRTPRATRGFVLAMLALESGLLGVLLSLNVVQFYFFWELTSLAAACLVAVWGGTERVFAATKLVLFSGVGSLALLLAILALARLGFEQGQAWNLDLLATPGTAGVPLLEIVVPTGSEPVAWWSRQGWLFAGFALAFGIRLPFFPVHGWLVDVQSEAPSAVRALIAGLFLQLGGYGFLRFALPLFPDAAAASVPYLSLLAVVGILHGALVAMVQQDVKRLLAHFCVVQLGFVGLGVFSLNEHGITGSVVQMLSSGLVMAALFLALGFIHERRHSTAIADFGGLAKPMPVFAACLGTLLLASIGLPGLSGFVGEFLVLLGSFRSQPGFAFAACVGSVLTAACILWAYRRIALGPVERPENRGLIDLDWRERSVLLALILPILAVGVHPDPVLRRVEPAVLELLQTMHERRSAPPLPAEEEAGTLARSRVHVEAGS